MIKVGYWYSEREPDLPMPVSGDFDDPFVIEYLRNGKTLHAWRGFSTCRICGVMNGTECLTDGTYQWPEGLEHYVEMHGVHLPQGFLDHIARNGK